MENTQLHIAINVNIIVSFNKISIQKYKNDLNCLGAEILKIAFDYIGSILFFRTPRLFGFVQLEFRMKYLLFILLAIPIVYSQTWDLWLYPLEGCRGKASKRVVKYNNCTVSTPFHALSASVSGPGCPGMSLWNTRGCEVGGYHWIACNTCTNMSINVQGVKCPWSKC